MSERTRKKLVEAHSWYKDIVVEEEGEKDAADKENKERAMHASPGNWRKGSDLKRKNRERLKELIEAGTERKKSSGEKIQGVIFVQHTAHSTLAKRIREGLKLLEKVGSFKIKIVERTGDTLVDLLHRSNAWENEDCMREDCIVCNSKEYGSKPGSCRRRNITYETFCITCEKEEKKRCEKAANNTENLPVIDVVLDDILASESIPEAPEKIPEKDKVKEAIAKFLNSSELSHKLGGSSEFNLLSSADENAVLPTRLTNENGKFLNSSELSHKSGESSEFNLMSSADENAVLPTTRLTNENGKEDTSDALEDIGGNNINENVEIFTDKDSSKKRKRHDKKLENSEKKITQKNRVYIAKYIGESSRSAYERGKEHVADYKGLNETSHILKHALIAHEGKDIADIEFGMRVTSTFRSALERQISEAVKIEREYRVGKMLLNSKSEFNRCEIPRLMAGN